MLQHVLTNILFLLSILSFNPQVRVHAHLGESLTAELTSRAQYLRTRPRDITSCAQHLDRRGHVTAGLKRRRNLITTHQKNLPRSTKRAIEDLSAPDIVFPPNLTDPRLLFPSSNDSSNCILTPEVAGLGHFIPDSQLRSDIRDQQPGVPLTLEVQLINTQTCQPLEGVYVEVYQCNATGVYSGVQAVGNGDVRDEGNLRQRFGRGVQVTDGDGVVTFTTIFPGHYYGVAPHIHILSHSSPVNSSSSSSSTSSTYILATHNGRLFFPQPLISSIESTAPYSSNTQALTLNSEDAVLLQEAKVTDPYVRYTWLGERVEDGLVAWISVGIDPTAVHPMAVEGGGRGGNGGA